MTRLPDRAPRALRVRARQVLEAAWRADPGFCVPNDATYPHQWLWDSCFHSVVWSSFGDSRAIDELRSALASQDRSTGFVPHIAYWHAPRVDARFWGRVGMSSITQPPVFGHAVAQAVRAGLAVDVDLIERATSGLRHLLEQRPRRHGLVCVFHPWETGCDDSARWDDWCPGGFEPQRWWSVKGELVEGLRFDRRGGSPTGSGRFAVPSAGFNALLAWNALELSSVAATSLSEPAGRLVDALVGRWDPELRTWTDSSAGSGRVRTLDALLGVLVDPRDEVFDDLVDPAAFGAPFGPAGVHRDEPSADFGGYWRGASWPQLSYLLAVAARRAGRHDVADSIMLSLRSAVERNGFAEYWDPRTGAGGGAAPQTWSTLAVVPV